jgi:hypothetical protein
VSVLVIDMPVPSVIVKDVSKGMTDLQDMLSGRGVEKSKVMDTWYGPPVQYVP